MQQVEDINRKRFVYVIEINPALMSLIGIEVSENQRCFYVGETAKWVGARFTQHRSGLKHKNAARVFRRLRNATGAPLEKDRDIWLRRDLSRDLEGYREKSRAEAQEATLAAALRAQGHLVFPRKLGTK